MIKKMIIFLMALMIGSAAGHLFIFVYEAHAVGGPGVVKINVPGQPENVRIESRDE